MAAKLDDRNPMDVLRLAGAPPPSSAGRPTTMASVMTPISRRKRRIPPASRSAVPLLPLARTPSSGSRRSVRSRRRTPAGRPASRASSHRRPVAEVLRLDAAGGERFERSVLRTPGMWSAASWDEDEDFDDASSIATRASHHGTHWHDAHEKRVEARLQLRRQAGHHLKRQMDERQAKKAVEEEDLRRSRLALQEEEEKAEALRAHAETLERKKAELLARQRELELRAKAERLREKSMVDDVEGREAVRQMELLIEASQQHRERKQAEERAWWAAAKKEMADLVAHHRAKREKEAHDTHAMAHLFPTALQEHNDREVAKERSKFEELAARRDQRISAFHRPSTRSDRRSSAVEMEKEVALLQHVHESRRRAEAARKRELAATLRDQVEHQRRAREEEERIAEMEGEAARIMAERDQAAAEARAARAAEAKRDHREALKRQIDRKARKVRRKKKRTDLRGKAALRRARVVARAAAAARDGAARLRRDAPPGVAPWAHHVDGETERALSLRSRSTPSLARTAPAPFHVAMRPDGSTSSASLLAVEAEKEKQRELAFAATAVAAGARCDSPAAEKLSLLVGDEKRWKKRTKWFY